MPITNLFPHNPVGPVDPAAPIEVQGNGIMVHQNGQFFARELVPVPGIGIAHPSGIDGAPRFTAQPGMVTAGTTEINLATLDEQPIHLNGYYWGKIERVIFWGASTDITQAVGSIRTAQAQTGLSIVAGQALAALSTAYGSHIEVEAATSAVGAFPVLFFKASVAEGGVATCKCSVIVQGLVGQEY